VRLKLIFYFPVQTCELCNLHHGWCPFLYGDTAWGAQHTESCLHLAILEALQESVFNESVLNDWSGTDFVYQVENTCSIVFVCLVIEIILVSTKIKSKQRIKNEVIIFPTLNAHMGIAWKPARVTELQGKILKY